jgi:uncharacterized protein involved in exopolysaccharide biosynthesis
MAFPSSRPSLRGQLIDADFDLAALASALWRQKGKILRPTLLVALLAFAAVEFITPKYQSESKVLLVGRDNVFLRPDADRDTQDRGAVDPEAVMSQVQLILSRDLAREVIDKLKLGDRAEFDPAIGGVGLVKSVLGTLGLTRNPMSMTPQERVLEAYYDRLSVFPVDKSRVIVIDFLSENPELAAQVANAVADAYLERQQVAKQEQVRTAGQWLAGEIEPLRKRVAEAEAKVAVFRGKSGLLVGPNNTTLPAQQLGDINAQLATARAQKADVTAKAKLIRTMLKAGGEIESSDILNSELIRRLSEQRVTLRAQLAEQSTTLLGNHPRIKELRAQIDDLDKQIRGAAETIARSLEIDAKLADARVESLLGALDSAKNQAVTGDEEDVQLRALERDAKSQRDLLESYLAKYREASARNSLNSVPPDARVISRATVSNVPAYPKKLPTVAIASIAAFVLATGLVLTRELLNAGTAVTLSGLAGAAPGYGAADGPAGGSPGEAPLPGGRDGSKPVRLEPRSRSQSAARDFADKLTATGAAGGAGVEGDRQFAAIDRLASRLARAGRTQPPAAAPESAIADVAADWVHHRQAAPPPGITRHASPIAFIAATPQLEATTTAIRFGRTLAADARVVLVGLGGNETALKVIAADPAARGLAALDSGEASFGDVITRDRSSSLNLVLSGGASRAAMLASPAVATAFAALSRSYEHVVIDAGALGGYDLSALARIAPHVILLAESPSGAVTERARADLTAFGFDDVTVIVAAQQGANGEFAA